MDGLMWALVLADVGDRLSTVLLLVSITTLITGAIAGAITAGVESTDEDYKGMGKRFRQWARPFIIAAIPMLVLGTLIPSKQTIYIVAGVQAAREITDKVTGSALGQKTLTLLERRLDEALAEPGVDGKAREVIVVQQPGGAPTGGK